MQEISVFDVNGNRLLKLTQWDKNIRIYIKNIDNNIYTNVHFFNLNSKEALVVSTEYQNGILSAKIPDSLLEESLPIFGYVCQQYEDETKSICGFKILVTKRPRPSDFIDISSQDYESVTKILLECIEYANLSESVFNGSKENYLNSKSYAVGGTGIRDGEDTDNAKYYSEQANIFKTAALSSEQNAKTSENNAHNDSVLASNSEKAATLSEKNAKESENATKNYMDSANKSKEQAFEAEKNSLNYKNAAAVSEQNAKASELAAKQSEETVLSTIDEATESATLSESWAIGGTETRTDEDTNNSKYFSQQSRQHNDNALTHETAARSYAVGGTGTRTGEDTDNAKYYYTQLQTMMGNMSFATVDEAKTYLGY